MRLLAFSLMIVVGYAVPISAQSIVTPAAVIPSGTRLEVVLGRQLSSRTDKVGNTFTASLVTSVQVARKTILGKATPLRGQIIDLDPGVSRRASITMVLDSLIVGNGGTVMPIWTEPLRVDRRHSTREIAVLGILGAASAAAVMVAQKDCLQEECGAPFYAAITPAILYEGFRKKDVVLSTSRKLVFKLAGDVHVQLSTAPL